MRAVLFCHSIESDWNHGNAHFLRGLASEMVARGYDVDIYEPADSWSRRNLLEHHGVVPLLGYHKSYPLIPGSHRYHLDELNLDLALAAADLVLVHEWNDPDLVARIGRHHARQGGYTLLFHDTHHRSVTAPEEMSRFDLSEYDGVLAFGDAVRRVYENNAWAQRVWTLHEAADPRVFHPMPGRQKEGDLVWIGNWGDDERSAELREFLIEPVRALKLKAKVYGVRYPAWALDELAAAGIEYGGWLPNYEVPRAFAQYRVTVHVPRRPYAQALRGIPTIRPFEALACGIPLISAPWSDCEGLFGVGVDFRMVRSGSEMCAALQEAIADDSASRQMATSGMRRILDRHTCAHRLDQIEAILAELTETTPDLVMTGEV